MTTDTYQHQLRAALSPAERAVFAKLTTPKKIQSFLDSFPINFSKKGEGILSPRNALKLKKMHCIEGALVAAAALAYHGQEPLLVDFQTTGYDEDHVVAVFKINNLWGAISKTNHPVLRWRDPVYKSVRELAMSYFHEYYMWSGGPHHGKKTMRTYSKPFNLKRYKPAQWVTSETDVDWLAIDLDDSPHLPAFPARALTELRKASAIETKAMKLSEWKKK